jgi:His/Glu/Gln/Arg/opine family amino acid ABC transporter permease subunit
MGEFGEQFLNVAVMTRVAPMIVAGALQTLLLCALLVPIGLLGGLGAAVLATSGRLAVRWPTMALIDFFRAFPPLVLLIFIYSGLPFAGIRLRPLSAICVAFLTQRATTARSTGPGSRASAAARLRPGAPRASPPRKPSSSSHCPRPCGTSSRTSCRTRWS